MSSANQEERPQPPQDMQSKLFEALAASSKRGRAQGASLASFTDEHETQEENGTNKYDLLCPQEGCGSVILLKGAATHLRKDTIDPIDSSEYALPPSLPTIDHTSPSSWWHITGSPMAFENISFSKPVFSCGVTRKLLACAECEVGPLGWSMDSDYYLSTSRVSYRRNE